MKPGPSNPRWQRALLWAVAAVVLAAVFAAYLSPHMAVDLATRVWSCF
jgi:type II secretory pathway component PulM